MIKARLCFELQREGKEYYTEAPIGKNIADIYVLDTNEVIEIQVTETQHRLEIKSKKFTASVRVISISEWTDYWDGLYKVIREV